MYCCTIVMIIVLKYYNFAIWCPILRSLTPLSKSPTNPDIRGHRKLVEKSPVYVGPSNVGAELYSQWIFYVVTMSSKKAVEHSQMVY